MRREHYTQLWQTLSHKNVWANNPQDVIWSIWSRISNDFSARVCMFAFLQGIVVAARLFPKFVRCTPLQKEMWQYSASSRTSKKAATLMQCKIIFLALSSLFTVHLFVYDIQCYLYFPFLSGWPTSQFTSFWFLISHHHIPFSHGLLMTIWCWFDIVYPQTLRQYHGDSFVLVLFLLKYSKVETPPSMCGSNTS